MSDIIISVQNISKVFPKPASQDISVLDNIDLSLRESEIVCLLGTSGSGKSTLLRIMSGLIKPSSGIVSWYGQPIKGPIPGVSMVFQNFALLPWLTVLENVELGLEANNIPPDQRRKRALAAIDIVGMDGFESAYPKELSGGMCQRVGFARAIVVEPDVLFMDEPFSALDVLTAENLRNDLIDLWVAKKTKLKAILMVTHNIYEAAYMADRILIFGTNPGRIMADLKVDMPYDRNPDQSKFTELVDSIYHHITQASDSFSRIGGRLKPVDIHFRLPEVEISTLIGLVETLHSEAPTHQTEISDLAQELHLDLDDLLPIIDSLQLLRFAQLRSGRVELTFAGKMFAEASLLDQKQIFARQLLDYLPIVKHIHKRLNMKAGHSIHQSEILMLLRQKLSDTASEDVLKTVIEWSRYAEVFAFDVNSGHLSLDNPGEVSETDAGTK